MSYSRSRMGAPVDPGIDTSLYSMPYAQMLGVGGLGGLGSLGYTGPPADDPRIVKRFQLIKAYVKAINLPNEAAAGEARTRLETMLRQAVAAAGVPATTINTAWGSGNRAGQIVITINPGATDQPKRRFGLIKQGIHQGVVNASAGVQQNYVRPDNNQVGAVFEALPAGAFEAAATGGAATITGFPTAPPGVPPPPVGYALVTSGTPGAASVPAPPGYTIPPGFTLVLQTTATDLTAHVPESFFTKKVAGLPVWAIGLIGIGVVGTVVVVATSGRKKAAPTPNRRRSRRRRSSRRRIRRNFFGGKKKADLVTGRLAFVKGGARVGDIVSLRDGKRSEGDAEVTEIGRDAPGGVMVGFRRL